MLRQFAERMSRNIVIRRRLPKEFGRRPFYVSPDSALAYIKPGFSGFSDLTSIVSECVKPGHCVWDVGGNLGVFSFLAADRVGEAGAVVTVEPDPFLASLIQKSILLNENQDRTISVLCAAISEQSGIARFLVAERGRSSNSLEQTGQRSQAGGTRYSQFVPTTTLDQMLDIFPEPQFLKIDVEGAEALVLKGGSRLLKDIRPQIYVEVGAQQSKEVTDFFKPLGYTLFDGNADFPQCFPVTECTFNTLAVPSETIDSMSSTSAKRVA